MEKDLIEVHDHAGNKVMIPKSEAMRLHGMMENKKHFDPEHYLDKAREKMQESDWEHEYPDTEEKVKAGLARALDLDFCGAEYLYEAMEAVVACYLLKMQGKKE